MAREVDVLIPAYNEGAHIATTLDSILAQNHSGKSHYNVAIIANGCSDDTIPQAVAAGKRFVESPYADLQIFETPTNNKIHALNLGLAATSSEVVLCTDGDVTFSPHCFEQVTDKLLHQPGVMVSGAVPKIVVPEALGDTLLGQVVCVSEMYYAARAQHTAPFGMMMGFRREAVPKFAEDAVVDDTWLGLSVAYRYGADAVELVSEAEVYGKAPTNWSDYLAQRTRWSRNNRIMTERFPEFEPVLAERRARREASMRPPQEIEQEVKARMQQEGIPEDRWAAYKLFGQITSENAGLMPGIVDATGNWTPIATTK